MTKIKARIYKIINQNSMCFATVKIMSPKEVKYCGCIINTDRISKYSILHPIYIGQEQGKKDSLYVPTNCERTWVNGHTGHFWFDESDMYDVLTPEEIIKYGLSSLYHPKLRSNTKRIS